MNDLADRLREIERNQSPELWDEIAGRAVQPPATEGRGLRHRVAAGLVAAVVSVAAFTLLASVFRADEDRSTTSIKGGEITILVSSSGPSSDLALLTGTLTTEDGCVAVATGPSSSVFIVWPAGYSLVEAGDDVWLLDDTADRVARIGDEVTMGGGTTNLAHAETEVAGGIPSSCEVGGDDAYWFSATPELVASSSWRPETEPPIPYPSDQAYGGGITMGAGSVWVGLASGQNDADGSVLRIDPTTNEIITEIPIAGATFRHRLAATDDAVWVATTGGLVQRIDPATNAVAAEIDLGAGVSALAADESAVWAVAFEDRSDEGRQNLGRLIRIDPATDEVVAEVPIGEAATGYEDEIIIGDGAVWVLGSRLVSPDEEDGGNLVRIDPASNTVAASLPVDGFRMVLAEDGRTIWVRSPEDGLFDDSQETWVWRTVDTWTNEVSAPFSFPSAFEGGLSVVDNEALWSVSYDRNESVVVVRSDPESLEVVATSKPIEDLYTDAIVDVASGTAWITTATEGIVPVDLSP